MKEQELEAGPFEDLITEADEGMPRGSEAIILTAFGLMAAADWLLSLLGGGRHA